MYLINHSLIMRIFNSFAPTCYLENSLTIQFPMFFEPPEVSFRCTHTPGATRSSQSIIYSLSPGQSAAQYKHKLLYANNLRILIKILTLNYAQQSMCTPPASTPAKSTCRCHCPTVRLSGVKYLKICAVLWALSSAPGVILCFAVLVLGSAAAFCFIVLRQLAKYFGLQNFCA